MNQVSNFSRLGCHTKTFTGKSFEKVIKAIEDWSKLHRVNLNNFYLHHKAGSEESVTIDLERIEDSNE